MYGDNNLNIYKQVKTKGFNSRWGAFKLMFHWTWQAAILWSAGWEVPHQLLLFKKTFLSLVKIKKTNIAKCQQKLHYFPFKIKAADRGEIWEADTPSPFVRKKRGHMAPATSHYIFSANEILQPLTFIVTQGCQYVNSLFDPKRKTGSLLCHYSKPLSISHSPISAVGQRLNIVLGHVAAAVNAGS